MSVICRPYQHPEDYERVDEFLVRSYASMVRGPHRNWLEPRWEYMHYHPSIFDQQENLARCGIWLDAGTLIGAVHFEDRLGVIYIQLDPSYAELKCEMLEYAMEHLAGDFKVGRAVHVFLDEDDNEWHEIARRLGYERMPEPRHAEIMTKLEAEQVPNRASRLDGFEILGLDEDDDVRKVHRVMHRGFNHEGDPPEEELEGRRRKLSAPSLRKDLTVVARAPSGDFVSFCGMWFDSVNRIAYVEPVATDPDYRRRGLGTAVVLEAARRCVAEGATAAYVGSDQPFYRAMGFRPVYAHRIWRKQLGG